MKFAHFCVDQHHGRPRLGLGVGLEEVVIGSGGGGGSQGAGVERSRA